MASHNDTFQNATQILIVNIYDKYYIDASMARLITGTSYSFILIKNICNKGTG